MRLTWEVDGVGITVEKLEDGIEEGMEEAVEKILEHLEREAKNVIAIRPSVFTGEVYESFDDQTGSADIKSGHSSRFLNVSRHAGALEHGVHQSKYADGGPPVEALMPWVIAKLSDWNIDTSDSGGTGGAAVKVETAGEDEDTDNVSENKETEAFGNFEEDWTRFSDDGYNAEGIWTGQDVVFYENGEYKSGTVVSVNKDQYNRTVVKVEDGNQITYDYNIAQGRNPTNGSGIVVGADWNSLSDDEKRTIGKSMLSDVDIDSSFNTQWTSDIEDGLQQYGDNLKDVDQVKRLAIYIDSIEKNNSLPARGRWQDPLLRMQFNTNNAKPSTISHEIAHAWAYSNGRSYVEGARHKTSTENWNTVDLHGTDAVKFDYDSQGENNWPTSKGDNFPHPSTYMMYDEEERDGVGPYDDVAHDDFDHWQEYVRKETKSNLQHADDAGPPDYGMLTEAQVLDPDGGAASEGDAMAIEMTVNGNSKVMHLKIESSVYQKDDGTYTIDVSQDGSDNNIDITDDGFIASDKATFEGYLRNGADDLEVSDSTIVDPEDVPDDPGFFAPEGQELDRFFEGLNRQQWREMLVAELGDHKQKPEFFMRTDGYSGINTHEITAHFMAIIYSKGGTSAEQNVVDLLNTNPELIYVAAMVTEFSPEIVEALERESGLSFDELLFDIYRTNIQ